MAALPTAIANPLATSPRLCAPHLAPLLHRSALSCSAPQPTALMACSSSPSAELSVGDGRARLSQEADESKESPSAVQVLTEKLQASRKELTDQRRTFADVFYLATQSPYRHFLAFEAFTASWTSPPTTEYFVSCRVCAGLGGTFPVLKSAGPHAQPKKKIKGHREPRAEWKKKIAHDNKSLDEVDHHFDSIHQYLWHPPQPVPTAPSTQRSYPSAAQPSRDQATPELHSLVDSTEAKTDCFSPAAQRRVKGVKAERVFIERPAVDAAADAEVDRAELSGEDEDEWESEDEDEDEGRDEGPLPLAELRLD